MKQLPNAWAIRPFPHGVDRIQDFLDLGIAAIGWPAVGDLAGADRQQIHARLRGTYYREASAQSIGQAVGILHRFANQIRVGDAVVVPYGASAYFGVVAEEYSFHPETVKESEGYPHWVRVAYQFERAPLPRSVLPAVLFDALKGRQTVFTLPAASVWEVIRDPARFEWSPDAISAEDQARYRDALVRGRVPGINSPQFEEAVRRVLERHFPGLRRLATTNAPVGADTDLLTELPGGIVVRVQVKCFQDQHGFLEEWAVNQLRASMQPGEHGIVVTTGSVSDGARAAAEADPERPIGLISGDEFADMVFQSLPFLGDQDIWLLGLRRAVVLR